MGKYFGTDGFRGEANVTLTSDRAYKVGRFVGWLYSTQKGGDKARIVIGKDTRLSSYMLEYSIAAGITASGADAYMLHVTTTPSVSYVTRVDGFDLGIMITASHNPYCDNGIKLIGRGGDKLDDRMTDLIEKYIDGELPDGITGDLPFATGAGIGRIVDFASGRNRYVGYLISLASSSYKGLRIGLDAANGSAWMIARSVFDALGAKTYVIGAEPNGLNVNESCGSTHIEALVSLVKENSLDLGFAFDGDADRCIAVDANGDVVDGDKIMYLLAKRMKQRGVLNKDTVVATVMSNSGFVKSLENIGIHTELTKVGDRYVYERMQDGDYAIGGEQSGHVIIKKYATTGDGVLTAIMVCEQICDSKSTLASLTREVELYPQYTENVRVSDKEGAMNDASVLAELREVEKIIDGNGRVLLRASGTEPVVRIMIEYKDKDALAELARRIADKIKEGGYADL